MPIQDGIGALIKLHCKDPLPEHVWSKDKPRRRRERIKYIESQDNTNFSVEIFFVPGQIKFDRSIHWRISIYFEGDRVWTWTVKAEDVVTNGKPWCKNVIKGNAGIGKGKEFYFRPVQFPDHFDEDALRSIKSDQDTISVRFYRLLVVGEGPSKAAAAAAARSRQEQDNALHMDPKTLLKDPERRFSHRPGLRAPSTAGSSGASSVKKEIRYRQQDDEDNPFYVFDFKLRSQKLLRELGLLGRNKAPAEFNARARRTVQVNSEFEQLDSHSNIKAEIDNDYDFNVVFDRGAIIDVSDDENSDEDDAPDESNLEQTHEASDQHRSPADEEHGIKRSRGNSERVAAGAEEWQDVGINSDVNERTVPRQTPRLDSGFESDDVDALFVRNTKRQKFDLSKLTGSFAGNDEQHQADMERLDLTMIANDDVNDDNEDDGDTVNNDDAAQKDAAEEEDEFEIVSWERKSCRLQYEHVMHEPKLENDAVMADEYEIVSWEEKHIDLPERDLKSGPSNEACLSALAGLPMDFGEDSVKDEDWKRDMAYMNLDQYWERFATRSDVRSDRAASTAAGEGNEKENEGEERPGGEGVPSAKERKTLPKPRKKKNSRNKRISEATLNDE